MELILCLLIVVAIACLVFSSLRRRSCEAEGFSSENKYRYTFIKFYTPWCGYCKRLQPEWRKLQNKYSDKIGFEEYNCDIQKQMCSRHDVTGYPTLKIRDNLTQKFLQYDGPREYQAMAAFLDTVIGR
jgi:thiol-disulfide isomerase/thioredoxin